jgi:ribosome biogenesis GTPase A
MNNGKQIQYYPGHMAKTKRLIKEKYNLIDIVYEVIDARMPFSSKIKDIDDLLKDKTRILIMTKYDLCDKEITKYWIDYYKKMGYHIISLDLNKNNSTDTLVSLTNELMDSIQTKRVEKGLAKKDIRALVIGIPNVGKSTLINRMAGRKAANVGNQPGVTKNISWLRTDKGILLLDSPGILWPKFDNEIQALNLASLSSIPMEVLPVDRVAIHVLTMLDKYYPNILKERYGIDHIDIDDIGDTYDKIGKRIGAIISGGEIDYEKVSKRILEDIKQERIKGITFDRIGEM